MKRLFRKFRKPASVSGILADFHGKVKQLEQHKINTARKIDQHAEEEAAAKFRGHEASAEWSQAHYVLGKLNDLLGLGA